MKVDFAEYDALVLRICDHVESSGHKLHREIAKGDVKSFARDLTLSGMMLSRLFEMLGYEMRFAINGVEVKMKWPALAGRADEPKKETK